MTVTRKRSRDAAAPLAVCAAKQVHVRELVPASSARAPGSTQQRGVEVRHKGDEVVVACHARPHAWNLPFALESITNLRNAVDDQDPAAGFKLGWRMMEHCSGPVEVDVTFTAAGDARTLLGPLVAFEVAGGQEPSTAPIVVPVDEVHLPWLLLDVLAMQLNQVTEAAPINLGPDAAFSAVWIRLRRLLVRNCDLLGRHAAQQVPGGSSALRRAVHMRAWL